MIFPPTIYAIDPGGIWHIAFDTYPSHAECACGRVVRAIYFTTQRPGEEYPPDGRMVCALCRIAVATFPEPAERAG